MLKIILALSIILLTPLNAMAIEINDKGAQTLKDSFQKLLDYQKDINEIFETVRVIYEGEITVSQKNDYYAITLPHILLKSPETNNENENFVFDMGVIRINAMPDEKPENWKTIISFPSKMTMSNENNETDENDDFVINFGSQNTMAIFNTNLGYFTKFNLNLAEIGFKDKNEDFGVNLGAFQVYTNTDQDENGDISGPGHILFSNLNIAPQDTPGTLKLGELKLDFNISKAKAYTISEYQEKFTKHAETLKSLGTLDEKSDLKAINNKNIMDMFFDLYDFEMDGFSFQYSVKDLEFTSEPILEDTEENAETNSYKLGSAFFGLGFDGLKAEKGSLNIKTGFNAIDMQPKEPKYTDTMPQSLNFDIKADNIPYTSLIQMGKTSAVALAENPGAAQMVGMSLLMRLPAILSQSGAQLVIEKNGIKNSIYDISLDGKIATELTNILGFSATLKAVFEGLDDLLNIANKYGVEPKKKENPTFEEISNLAQQSNDYAYFTSLKNTLETLKSIGKSETGPNGKAAYSFELETTPEGSLLINGQDAKTLSFK